MDIYEYLKADHRKVAKLFIQYKKTTQAKRKLEIIAYLIKELSIHAIAEQETFYNFLQKHSDNHNIIPHAEKEHNAIFTHMNILKDEAAINDTFEAHVVELKKIVDHHVKEEESQVFKEAKKILSEEEAINMKIRMHDYKEKLIYDSKEKIPRGTELA